MSGCLTGLENTGWLTLKSWRSCWLPLPGSQCWAHNVHCHTQLSMGAERGQTVLTLLQQAVTEPYLWTQFLLFMP